MNLSTILEQIGLTQKEAAVYLATLELAQASVLRIAQKTEIKRPTVYITLDTLCEKGFVVSIPKGSKTLYQAIDPKDILVKCKEKVAAFKDTLPEFLSLANAAPGKAKIRFFEGKNSLLALYENEIFRSKRIAGITSMRELRKVFSLDELTGMLHIMKSGGGKINEIDEDSPESREYRAEKDRLELGQTKCLPKGFAFEIDFLLYDNCVAMISIKNRMAVVIEDRAIAGAQRQFFNFLWDRIRPAGEEKFKATARG